MRSSHTHQHMTTRELLEDPDRQIPVPASLLADCIDMIRDYLSELGDRIDSSDLGRRRTVANDLWDRLSQQIEKTHGRRRE